MSDQVPSTFRGVIFGVILGLILWGLFVLVATLVLT